MNNAVSEQAYGSVLSIERIFLYFDYLITLIMPGCSAYWEHRINICCWFIRWSFGKVMKCTNHFESKDTSNLYLYLRQVTNAVWSETSGHSENSMISIASALRYPPIIGTYTFYGIHITVSPHGHTWTDTRMAVTDKRLLQNPSLSTESLWWNMLNIQVSFILRTMQKSLTVSCVICDCRWKQRVWRPVKEVFG